MDHRRGSLITTFISLIVTCLFSTAVIAENEDTSQVWRPVLSETDDRLAAGLQDEHGLALLIYSPGEDVFNLVYMPKRAQNGDPIVHFISANVHNGETEHALDFSRICSNNQLACHDEEHLRIQLSDSDLEYLSTADKLKIKYQSNESSARNKAWTVILPMTNAKAMIEHLVATGLFIKNRAD